MTKATATPVRKTAASAPKADTETNGSSLPLWKNQFHRVKVAMWSHPQKDGKTRETISICRSYQDEKEKWHNVHYFDRDDIRDIREALGEIEEQLLKLDGMEVVVGED